MKFSKTISYAALSILAVLSVPEIQALIAQYPVVATIVNGVIVGALRWATTTPLLKA